MGVTAAPQNEQKRESLGIVLRHDGQRKSSVRKMTVASSGADLVCAGAASERQPHLRFTR